MLFIFKFSFKVSNLYTIPQSIFCCFSFKMHSFSFFFRMPNKRLKTQTWAHFVSFPLNWVFMSLAIVTTDLVRCDFPCHVTHTHSHTNTHTLCSKITPPFRMDIRSRNSKARKLWHSHTFRWQLLYLSWYSMVYFVSIARVNTHYAKVHGGLRMSDIFGQGIITSVSVSDPSYN